MSKEFSFPKGKINIVLLEKIHPAAQEAFEQAGYSPQVYDRALSGDELNEMLSEAHIVGVRSATKIRAENLKHAKRLLAIGCYSVGTDQVALNDTASLGVAVFNAPHSSTRSVAELTIAAIFSLSRCLADRSAKMHQGVWEKSAAGSYEVRQKTLGIVGYGHIGQQVGLLADSIGMNVLFFDTVKKLPLGRARSVASIEELLKKSEFITLHVPGGAATKGLLGREQLALMKKGSYLLNMSRGSVVDISALKDALTSGALAGASLDVFPSEPASNRDPFASELCGLDNVILTPHIGGSTEEAQQNIGKEVSHSLINFLDTGSSEGSVNFPIVHLPAFPDSHRILNVHHNQPGVVSEINQIFADIGANIDAQYLSTRGDIGYLIVDINSSASVELKERLGKLSKSIRTRILY